LILLLTPLKSRREPPACGWQPLQHAHLPRYFAGPGREDEPKAWRPSCAS